jgi:cell division septation protein DedD
VTNDTTLNAETKKSVGDSLVLIDTIKQDKEVQKDSINNEKTIIDTSKPYLVLVGSFGELSNAKKMLKRVEKLGLSGTIKKIGRLHRVIIASSSSKKFVIDVKNRHNKTFGETPYVLKQ